MMFLFAAQPVAGYTGNAGKLLRQRHQPCKPHSVKTWHKLKTTMAAVASFKAPRTFKTGQQTA